MFRDFQVCCVSYLGLYATSGRRHSVFRLPMGESVHLSLLADFVQLETKKNLLIFSLLATISVHLNLNLKN